MEDPKELISTDPAVMHGEPHFHGTRIPVTVVLDNLKDGLTPDEILAQYPSLTEKHIAAALACTAGTWSGSEESLRDFQQLLEKARQGAAETGLTREDVEEALTDVRSEDRATPSSEWDLTPEQRQELTRRLEEHLKDPGSAIPWEEVKEQLTRRWRVTDHLGSPEECAVYLQAAIEEGDPELVATALGDVFGVTGICEQHGVERMWVFGSVLEPGRTEPPDDIDLLVRLQPMDPYERVDAYFGLVEGLRELLPLPTDLVMEDSIRNPYWKSDILATRRLIYERSQVQG
ncbi:MAG: DUF433 domain-containing protein [bacterium]